MCAVGPRTTMRWTRPARSMSWATFRPKVVLPAAGVAEARKVSPSWASRASRAARCQARRGLVPGQAGRAGAANVVIGARQGTGGPGRNTGVVTVPRVRPLVALAAGLALADASVVALALPALLRELDTTVEGVAAVLGVYVLVLALALLPAERALRRYGPARLGAAGFALFAVASLGCAAADSLGVLLVARSFQAVGGAAGLVAAFAGVGRDGRHLWTAAAVFGTACGPALGGAVTQALDWRWVFIVQAPIAVAAALAAHRLPATPPDDALERDPFRTGPAIALALVSPPLTAGRLPLRPPPAAGVCRPRRPPRPRGAPP